MTLKIALSGASLYLYPLRYTFRLAKELGFSGLELAMGPEVRWRGGRYVRELSRKYDLPVYGLHPPMFSGPQGLNLQELLPRMVHLGREMGCRMLVIHAPKVTTLEGGGLQGLEAILEARREGLLLSLENLALFGEEDRGYLLGDLHELRDFAEKHDLHLTLDTAHAGTFGYDLIEAYEILRPRLVNIHLSDLRHKKPMGGWSYFQTFFQHHQMPGEGYLPLGELLRCLKRDGYRGPVTVEISPFALGAWWPERVKRNLRKCLAFINGACMSHNCLGDKKGLDERK